jgi:hypothetical protein
MKIYRKKINPISNAIVDTMVRDEDIEILGSLHNMVVKDVASFIEDYANSEDAISESAKTIVDRKGLPASQIPKVKNILAQEKGVKLGDEALEFLADKIIRYFLTEDSIDEVYSEDATMRKKIFDIFRRHLDVDDDIDREVRARIKNIPENSPIFKIEYQKVLREVKRKRGLV